MTDQIVCTACGAINRLPPERDPIAAKCGGCGARLFAGEPADVTADMLLRQIGKGTIPVVVDIWAPWCGPCRFMAPEYGKAARALEPKLRFLKLNSDNEQAYAATLGIRGIPTMLLFRDGREADRVSGAMTASQIEAWLAPRLGPAA
jgi:thioredoxin 2